MNEELKFNDEELVLISQVGEQLKSRTQSVKVLVIEKKGQPFISVQKWWRKSSDEPWMEGKGFHFNLEEVTDLNKQLNDAIKQLTNSEKRE